MSRDRLPYPGGNYAWWAPSLFIFLVCGLLISGVLRNTLNNPYEKGFREDIGHMENIKALVAGGALVGNSDASVSTDETALLDMARKEFRFGRAYAFAESHQAAITSTNGRISWGEKAPVSDLERLLHKKHLSFDHQGKLQLHPEQFLQAVLSTSIGRHFILARNNLNRFSFHPDSGIQWDSFYFKEINTFSVRRRIPRGKILDRFDKPLASWKKGRRTYPENAPGTTHIVGYKNLFGLERKLNVQLTGDRDYGLHDLIGLLGYDRAGNDLRLSIDAELSQEIFDAFVRKDERMYGGAVVIEVGTGRILAAVSSPGFDSNSTNFDLIQTDPVKPLLFRAMDEIYFPGSTYKTIVAITMLLNPMVIDEHNLTITDPELQIPDERVFKRVKNHGGLVSSSSIDMFRAFAISSNTYFARQGVALGELVKTTAEAFYFNKRINILDNIEDTQWLAAQPEAYTGSEFDFDKRGDESLVAQFSIGQNQIKTHPLHMACIVQAIANDGIWVEPTLVSHIRKGHVVTKEENTRAFKDLKTGKKQKIVEKSIARDMQEAMRQVMNEKGGTGYRAYQLYRKSGETTDTYEALFRNSKRNKDLVQMAGKTGTAENDGGKPHAWFIGYAPYHNPRFAVAVVVENRGYGSTYAEPIAVKAIAKALSDCGIK